MCLRRHSAAAAAAIHLCAWACVCACARTTQVEATVPGVAFSSDIIVGFCGETDADHADTLSLLREMRYPLAFLFAYSRRDKTHAARHLDDDVPPDVKRVRLGEAMALYKELQLERRRELVGTQQLVR